MLTFTGMAKAGPAADNSTCVAQRKIAALL